MLSIKPRASKFTNCINQQLGLIIKRPKLISTRGKRQITHIDIYVTKNILNNKIIKYTEYRYIKIWFFYSKRFKEIKIVFHTKQQFCLTCIKRYTVDC